ncbi:hypothetical protein [Halapricum desulfuricans]|uniref:Uncharacterized protein n=1 Tax=Halapricum desulfuricans TaxID=2841257 RepID=A0A897N8L4_9EURY|nr:Uncharacterized protein HSR122_0148 [Halapricum desulfuricans]
MTTIQQVLFEVTAPYAGHPYYVTGHALFNALARRVDARTRRALQVSHGVFVPGEFGSYPEAHSQTGTAPYMGTGLRPVEAYDDLFLFRDGAQRWLLDSRPRDAHNTQDWRSYSGHHAVAPTVRVRRPADARTSRRTMRWYVHAYLHADSGAAGSDSPASCLPLADNTLDGLRVGAARNYGFGELALADTQTVDLDDLDYSRLREADAYTLDLITPYVLASGYPGADNQSIPWWWTGTDRLRRRVTRLVTGDELHHVETVDHGQVVGYGGDEPIATARNGIRRVGTHAKYGFGELRVRPASADRVPERVGVDGAGPRWSRAQAGHQDPDSKHAADSGGDCPR